MRLKRPIQTRCRCGSLTSLTSPHAVTRWLILQKARRHRTSLLRLLVGTRFQVLFHSPSGVLFTFPSRYWFTIGHQEVFSLARWSWQIPTEFLVFRRTQDTARGKFNFAYGAITLCSNVSQRFLLSSFLSCCSPTTPKCKHFGLGCSLFARRYSGNRLISFSSCRY